MFSYIRAGAKVLGYLDLKDVEHTNQAAVLEVCGRYYTDPLASETYNKGVHLGTLILETGSIL